MPGTGNVALSSTTSSHNPGNAGFLVPCSTGASDVSVNTPGVMYNFRDHETIVKIMSIFAAVEFVEANVVIYPRTVKMPAEGALRMYAVRYGVAPRTLLQTDLPTSGESVTYHANEGTFPPGIQLDFRAVEQRFGYPVFYIGNINIADKSSVSLGVQIDFTVRCSGQNFGGQGL